MPERDILREVRLRFGQRADCVVWRNSVGLDRRERGGKRTGIPYGLAPGATAEEQRIWNSLGGGGSDLIAMAHGGIATRPTRALIGEAGPEAVIPLSRGGGGMGWNLTVNVSGNVTRSEKELAEMVAGEIIKAMRGSGQPGGSPVSRGAYF